MKPKLKTGDVVNECYYTPKKDTSSATICTNCGKEKMLHTIGEGVKASKIIIYSLTKIGEL